MNRRAVSAFLFRRPWLRGLLTLSGPAAWFVLIYLLALVTLFISAFWRTDEFTGALVRDWNLDNFRAIFDNPTYRTIALRTIGMAAAVTVTDALLVGGDGRATGRKAGGVVDDEEVGQAGLALPEPGGLQRLQERLGHGQGVRPQRVTQPQQSGDAGVALEPQPGDVLAVADRPDDGHLLPARGVCSSAAGLDPVDDGLHLFLGGRRLHHDHHLFSALFS